ncbi:MAG: HEAT repeat domain-containing protein [Bacteroidota bacterium]
MRVDVARSLSNEGYAEGFAELERLATHADAEARRWAAHRLGSYFGALPNRLRPLLYRLAADPQKEVRRVPVDELARARMPDWEAIFVRALTHLAPEHDASMLRWLATQGTTPAVLTAIERLLRDAQSEDQRLSAFSALFVLIQRDEALAAQAWTLLDTHWNTLDPLWVIQPRFSEHTLAQLPLTLYDRLVEAGGSVPDPTPKQREHLLRLRERFVQYDDLATAEKQLASLLPTLDERPVVGTPFRTLADLALRHPTLRNRIVDTLVNTADLLEVTDVKRRPYEFYSIAYGLLRYGGLRGRTLLAEAVEVFSAEALRRLHWWRHDWSALDVLQAMYDRGLAPHVPSAQALNAAYSNLYDFERSARDDEDPLHGWKTPHSAIDALRALNLLYYFDTERESPPHYHELIEDLTETLVTCPFQLTACHQHFDRESFWLRREVYLPYHEDASVDLAIAAEGCAVRANISDSGDWVLMEDLLAVLNAIPKRLGWPERFVCATAVGQDASILFGDADALNEVLEHFWLDLYTRDTRPKWEARRAELRTALLADAA